jgi:hypothetical protein
MGQDGRAADSDIMSVSTTAAAYRTQVDRLLDPKNAITLSTLQRAAAMVGRRVIVELVRVGYERE